MLMGTEPVQKLMHGIQEPPAVTGSLPFIRVQAALGSAGGPLQLSCDNLPILVQLRSKQSDGRFARIVSSPVLKGSKQQCPLPEEGGLAKREETGDS